MTRERADVDLLVLERVEGDGGGAEDALEPAGAIHDVEALRLDGDVTTVRLGGNTLVLPAVEEGLDRTGDVLATTVEVADHQVVVLVGAVGVRKKQEKSVIG